MPGHTTTGLRDAAEYEGSTDIVRWCVIRGLVT